MLNNYIPYIISFILSAVIVGIKVYKRKKEREFINRERPRIAYRAAYDLHHHHEMFRREGFQGYRLPDADLNYYVHPLQPEVRYYMDNNGRIHRGNPYREETTAQDYIKIPPRKLPNWM